MRTLLNMVYLIIQEWLINIGELLISASQHMTTRLEPQLQLIRELVQSIIISFRSVPAESCPHKGLGGVPIYVFKEAPTDPRSVEWITRIRNNTSL